MIAFPKDPLNGQEIRFFVVRDTRVIAMRATYWKNRAWRDEFPDDGEREGAPWENEWKVDEWTGLGWRYVSRWMGSAKGFEASYATDFDTYAKARAAAVKRANDDVDRLWRQLRDAVEVQAVAGQLPEEWSPDSAPVERAS